VLSEDILVSVGDYTDVLTLTFTPSGTSVIVAVDAVATSGLGPTIGGGGGSGLFQLHNADTSMLVGGLTYNGGQASFTAEREFTGLTPGTAYTFAVAVKAVVADWECRPATYPENESLSLKVSDATGTGGTTGGSYDDTAVVAELADHETRISGLEAVPPGALTWPVLAVADIPNPAPYTGYAFIDPDTGLTYVWTGVEWRRWTTTLFTPPLTGDAAINLSSLVGRYRASVLSYADGDAVAAWPDESSAGNDLITHTAGTMVAAGIGGLKSVQFTKSTFYELTTPVSRPMTLFAVMKNTDTGSGSMVVTSGDVNSSYFGLVLGGGWRISDGSAYYVEQTAPTPMAEHVLYGTTDATTGLMVGVDGAKTANGNLVDLRAKYIGNWPYAGGGYNMQGLVSEILVYNAVLTDAQINDIIHQLGLIYGITVSV
jgi:hypothetical protein